MKPRDSDSGQERATDGRRRGRTSSWSSKPSSPIRVSPLAKSPSGPGWSEPSSRRRSTGSSATESWELTAEACACPSAGPPPFL